MRSYATTPSMYKVHAEDLRPTILQMHPGLPVQLETIIGNKGDLGQLLLDKRLRSQCRRSVYIFSGNCIPFALQLHQTKSHRNFTWNELRRLIVPSSSSSLSSSSLSSSLSDFISTSLSSALRSSCFSSIFASGLAGLASFELCFSGAFTTH